MRFGNMFRRGVHFLTDSLGKALSLAPGIKTGAKALDQLGVGGGRLGGFVDRAVGLGQKAHDSLSQFGEMTPDQQAKRLGNLAGKGLSNLFAQSSGGGRPGLGQFGGNFMSQGLQRLLG